MREDNKAQRREQIEAAAYELLAEKGFQNMSMLAVSKAAKASNETLYRWYGDKIGLFKALIATNTERVAAQLREALEGSNQSDQALAQIGPVLLSMLLGDRAIALNRAAAADASCVLGEALAQEGRGKVFPLIADLFGQLVKQGILRGDPAEIAALYVDLLVGDLQIRRATGALGPLRDRVIEDRARLAQERLFRLASVS
jgi:AcrR family transcriptional regulator